MGIVLRRYAPRLRGIIRVLVAGDRDVGNGPDISFPPHKPPMSNIMIWFPILPQLADAYLMPNSKNGYGLLAKVVKRAYTHIVVRVVVYAKVPSPVLGKLVIPYDGLISLALQRWSKAGE